MTSMATDEEEAYRHFNETLQAELVQNVKPVIMSLTMLAEDYAQSSVQVARAIEEYILKVKPDIKILGLYLMDSIMKNLRATTNYISIFETNVIRLFCKVFTAVDETNRKALYKLRQTWNDLFSSRTLYDLDRAVKLIDPAWPITAPAAPPAATASSSTATPAATPSVVSTIEVSNTTKPQTTTSSSQQLITATTVVKKQQPVQPTVSKPSVLTAVAAVNEPVTTSSTSRPQSLSHDRDPRLIQQRLQHQQPQQASTNNNSSSSTRPNDQQHQQAAAAVGVKPTLTSSETALNVATNAHSSSSDTSLSPHSLKSSTSSASSAKMTGSGTLKRPSSSDLHSKIDIKKPKTIVVSPPPDKDPTAIQAQVPLSKAKGPSQKTSKTATSSGTTTTSPKASPKSASKTKIPSTPILDTELSAGSSSSSSSSTQQIAVDTLSTSAPATSKPSSKQQRQHISNPSAQKSSKSAASSKQTTVATETTTTTTTGVSPTTTAATTTSGSSKAAAIATLKTAAAAKAAAAATQSSTTAAKQAANPTTGMKSIVKRLSNMDKISASSSSSSSSTSTSATTTTTTNQNHNNHNHNKIVNLHSMNKQNDLLQPLSDVDERSGFGDVDERFPSPVNVVVDHLDTAVKSLLEPSSTSTSTSTTATTSLNNITNHHSTTTTTNTSSSSFSPNSVAQSSGAAAAITSVTTASSNILSGLFPVASAAQSSIRTQLSPTSLGDVDASLNKPQSHGQENTYQDENQQPNITSSGSTLNNRMSSNNNNNNTMSNTDEYASYNDLPSIRARESPDSLTDSLLIIDGKNYRLAANVPRLLRIYYHDHEVMCDTRTKDVYIDKKRVCKMGEPAKEVTLNGRRVRLMYMGARVDVWIDGTAYQFAADAPPKPVTVAAVASGLASKRYYVNVDSRTMEMFFNNYRVCVVNTMLTEPITARLAPDDFEQHEISFVCPPKNIKIDGVPRKMRYDLAVPCIEFAPGLYKAIKFDSPTPKEVYIDNEPFLVPFDRPIRIRLSGRAHQLAWGGPGFEVIIDGRPCELQFNKPREIVIGTRPYEVCVCGEPPDVKILGRLPPELLNEYVTTSTSMSSATTSGTAVAKTSGDNQMRTLSSHYPQQQQHPSMMLSNQFGNKTVNSLEQSQAPNVQDLLNKLMAYKILPGQQPPPPHKQQIVAQKPSLAEAKQPQLTAEDSKVPDLTSMESELLKQKYPAAIKSLYLGQQCATCGNRFPPQPNTTSNVRYARHLDWHFRQNKKEKLEANKARSRAWYYSLSDWMLYEELSDEKSPPPPQHLQQHQQQGSTSSSYAFGMSEGIAEEDLVDRLGDELGQYQHATDTGGISTNNASAAASAVALLTSQLSNSGNFGNDRTCAASDDIGDSCCICNDPFEIFWCADKEEWHFKDAMRVDNKLYHPICFEDAHAQEEEHNNSSIGASRSQSFMETETDPSAAAETTPTATKTSSSSLVENMENEELTTQLVKNEPV